MTAADGDGDVDDRRGALTALVAPVRRELDAANTAREVGLAACRRVIRASGSAIRAVHRLDPDRGERLRAEAEGALREAQAALDPFPAVAHAGFLHDAAKEYAEACLTAALVAGADLPGPDEVGVEPVACPPRGPRPASAARPSWSASSPPPRPPWCSACCPPCGCCCGPTS